jgi:hypothetical protein
MRTVLVVVDTLNDFMHGVIGKPAAKRLYYSAFTETDDHLRALEYLSHGRAWFEAARATG